LPTEEFKSDSGKFPNAYKTLLEAGDDELENYYYYLGQVCAELATVEQTLSNQQSNSMGNGHMGVCLKDGNTTNKTWWENPTTYMAKFWKDGRKVMTNFTIRRK
jgi:hypothetical protein